jgi:hypothetical protein
MADSLPTRYRGVEFRSRLEVAWAIFFESCKIAWRYEPIHLRGYVPDFLLYEDTLLIEVKPTWWRSPEDHAIEKAAAQKIEASGWTGGYVIVGNCFPRYDGLGLQGRRASDGWLYAWASLPVQPPEVAHEYWAAAWRRTRPPRGYSRGTARLDRLVATELARISNAQEQD